MRSSMRSIRARFSASDLVAFEVSNERIFSENSSAEIDFRLAYSVFTSADSSVN